MMLDQLMQAQLMQALLGRGGNPREVFRTIQQIKRNQIFWELNYERTN